ncbi:MAG: hypothetical protein U5L11_00460 [Arhodomonas sp.]|nr:hypothetical protein [Arhodomonas sp.]
MKSWTSSWYGHAHERPEGVHPRRAHGGHRQSWRWPRRSPARASPPWWRRCACRPPPGIPPPGCAPRAPRHCASAARPGWW